MGYKLMQCFRALVLCRFKWCNGTAAAAATATTANFCNPLGYMSNSLKNDCILFQSQTSAS